MLLARYNSKNSPLQDCCHIGRLFNDCCDALSELVSGIGKYGTLVNNNDGTVTYTVTDPLAQNGDIEELEGGGPVLGILPGIKYTEHSKQIDPGDTLVIYSDGVSEAADPEENEFGEERLMELIREPAITCCTQLKGQFAVCVGMKSPSKSETS